MSDIPQAELLYQRLGRPDAKLESGDVLFLRAEMMRRHISEPTVRFWLVHEIGGRTETPQDYIQTVTHGTDAHQYPAIVARLQAEAAYIESRFNILLQQVKDLKRGVSNINDKPLR